MSSFEVNKKFFKTNKDNKQMRKIKKVGPVTEHISEISGDDSVVEDWK